MTLVTNCKIFCLNFVFYFVKYIFVYTFVSLSYTPDTSLRNMLRKISFFALTLILVALQVQANQGSSCPTITPTIDFTITSGSFGSITNRRAISPTVNSSSIVRVSQPGFYSWDVNNNNNIRGIIVESGVNLTMGSENPGNTPSFSIVGTTTEKAYIIVKSGAVLTLDWISNLTNAVVCVEDGGSINFDSEDDRRNNIRNSFTFDGVDIVLGGSDAKVNFDNANVVLGSGGVTISGWEGSIACDASGRPTNTGNSGNITWTSSTTNICELTRAVVLPVEFVYIKGNLNAPNRTVTISWATAKEWENSHFEIERAIDQVNSFETIGEVDGEGFSDELVTYAFEDAKLPLSGGMAYYRLKQVDFDGTYTYSEVVAVRIPAPANVSNVWKAFPNPNKGGERFNLELVNRGAYANEEVIVKLVSPVGKQQVFTGKDLRVISDNITQSFQKSTNGLYIVEIAWGNQKEQIKVMKQ